MIQISIKTGQPKPNAMPMVLYTIRGDGNCMFRAISHQLSGSEEHHVSIRHHVCNFIERHSTHFANFITRDIADFIQDMRKDKTYGDDKCLYAFSFMTNIGIVVHRTEGRNNWICKDVNTEPEQIIHLLYKNEHYDSILTKPKVALEECCAQPQAMNVQHFNNTGVEADLVYAWSRRSHDSLSHPLSDHTYCKRSQEKFIDEAVEIEKTILERTYKLVMGCKPASRIIMAMEESLHRTGEKALHALPALEQIVKTVAQDVGTISGVYYELTTKSQGSTLSRYVESGVFDGFTQTNCQTEDKTVHHLRVYTSDDLHPKSYHGEPNQRLKKWIFGNKKSMHRLVDQLVSALESSPFLSLISLVVHVLRRGADIRKPHDSYLFVHPERQKPHVCDSLNAFIDNRPPTVMRFETSTALGVSCMPLPVTFKKQFDIISAISNDAKKSYYGMSGAVNVPKKASMENMLLYQRPKHPKSKKSGPLNYPTSLRNRLLFFALQDDVPMVQGQIRFWANGCPDAAGGKPDVVEPEPSTAAFHADGTEKRKHFSTSTVSIDAQPKPRRTVFEHFQQRLRLDGVIIWRRLYARPRAGVFVMNSINTKSAQMMSNSFEHVEYTVSGQTVAFTRCTCSVFFHIYDAYQDQSQKQPSQMQGQKACVHGRFLETYLKELCIDPKLIETDHQSALYAKIKSEMQLGDVVILPECEGKYALKMSVSGLDTGLLAMIHLCPDREKLSCMSGGCSYFTQNQKSSCVRVLLDTTNPKHTKFVCQHMRQLLEHKDEWIHHCATDEKSKGQAEEIDLELVDQHLCFDQESGLWIYHKALGKARRLPEDSPYHVENNGMFSATDSRTPDGYIMTDSTITPTPLDDTKPCLCGGIYQSGQLENDFPTTLYTLQGPVKIWAQKRVCSNRNPRCDHHAYDDTTAIHFWSHATCAVDALAWEFVKSIEESKYSFSAFCNRMTRTYCATCKSAKFMSAPVFVKWFISWVCALKIDFRQSVDPWCKYEPTVLVGDGTHIGVAAKYLKREEIRLVLPDTEDVVNVTTRRYHRVFLPYRTERDQFARVYRRGLRWFCCDYLKIQDDTFKEVEIDSFQELYKSGLLLNNILCLAAHDAEKILLCTFMEKKYPLLVQRNLARLLYQLSRDSPLSSFLQYRKRDDLKRVFELISVGEQGLHKAIETLEFYSPLIAAVVRSCCDLSDEQPRIQVCSFLLCLLQQVVDLHADDEPMPMAQEIPGTYRPETGVAYWFSQSGCQVRMAPNFSADKNQPSLDVLDARCTKDFPRVSNGGFSYMFVWLCPRHGHCYGYHLIPNQEGQKDAFYSLYKYCADLPECVVYDSSCLLHEYALNRMPSFARRIRFCDDKFHSYGHKKCALSYRANECGYLRCTNTSRAEQFNSYLNCVKFTASHLSKIHFCVFVQFFLHRWNTKKTESYKNLQEFTDLCCE